MKHFGRLMSSLVLIGVILALTGCAGAAGSRQPVVIIEGAEQTAVAATAFYERQTATAAVPTQTPFPTAEPYARPTENPDVPGDTVIATVAGHDITVAEFQNRVRFERWLALDVLFKNVQTASLTPADIANPANTMAPTIVGVLYTLQNAETFAETVLTSMLQERIMNREYADRGLDANTALYNNLWLNLIGLDPNGDGGLPEDFEAAQAAYLERIAPFTGITLEELDFRMLVRSERQTLLDAVGSEADLDPRSLEIRHILLATEEEANDVLAQLESGADFGALAVARSVDDGARGNGGDLGFFGRNEMVAPFEEAAFSGAVGEIVGPVQTEFGYHVIEILDHEDAYALRRIVVAGEDEALSVVERLANGEDFETVLADVSLMPEDGGDLGYYTPDTVPPAWREMVFGAVVGDVVGPVQSADGFNVLQITDAQLSRVHARHILVETEEAALTVMDRLAAGEDFATLAAEVSIDPGAQGNNGNLGYLTSDQMPETFADAVYSADVGDIVGPIETEYGYHVAEILDSRLSMLAPSQLDEVKALHFQNWLRREVREVALDGVWQEVYPADPLPEHIAPVLAEFETVMNEALAALSAAEEGIPSE